MNRAQQIAQLQTEEYDVLVIGGGASGAGCALDSTLRGYRTALIEKKDFAAATSSKSTKLIHGGVRYLEQAFKNLDFAQLAQVRHGLKERHTVLKNAPHLARPLALVTPVFSWFEGLYFTLGLTVYSWFASKKDSLPPSAWLSKKEVLERLPHLSRKIHSAVLYYDGQLDDARYCLALAHSAAEAGASVANHLSVIGFEQDDTGRLTAAVVRDELSGETFRIRAKVFINCTGPVADTIRTMANPAVKKRIRPSKGVHAILPAEVLGGEDALLIPKTPDGRVVFAVPFKGKLMLGTTDNDYEQLGQEPIIERQEIDFLLETLEPYLDEPARAEQVTAGFGGLRPLIAAEPGKGTKGLVRDHEVEIDPATQLVSLLGGKWTTYRLMAEDTIDTIEAHFFNTSTPSQTADHVLVGGTHYHPDQWKGLQQSTQLPEDICQHLSQHYGSRVSKVAELIQQQPDLSERLTPHYPYIRAEVVYAAREEMAGTVRDFLARRIRLEILDWKAAQQAAGMVAQDMGRELGWSEQEQLQRAEAYVDLLYQFIESTRADVPV